MFRIRPQKGQSFVVNGNHVLTLIRTPSNHHRYPSERGGQIIDVTVNEWQTWPKWRKHIHKLYKTGVDFKSQNTSSLTVDPYFLGVILGDGSMQVTPCITTADNLISEEAAKQAKQYGLLIRTRPAGGKSQSHYLTHGIRGKVNPLTAALKGIGIWGTTCDNKFIPTYYKTASRKDRLSLLAGLIDTDGYLSGDRCYDITSKSKTLANDIAFVARSVGLYASVKPCIKASQNGTKDQYYRVIISGNIYIIPSKLKPATNKTKLRNPLHTGFKVEDLDSVEEYYGFVLDGDHRYLLDDFTVTHNSGKTYVLISILKCLPPKTPVLFMTKSASLVNQNYEEMLKWQVPDVGRWYDGHKEPNCVMCATIHKETFASLQPLMPQFKVIIVDEVHEAMSKLPVKQVYLKAVNAAVRIGISATPFKYAGKDPEQMMNIKGHFGAMFKIKSVQGGILTTKILQERGRLSKSQGTFYVITEPKTIKHEPYTDAVSLGIAENVYFLNVVKRLALSLSGRTLIMVERVKQGDHLRSMLPDAHWIQGKDSVAVREEVFDELRKEKNVVAIAMRHIVTAGINVFIHNLINASGGKAEHSIIQQMGRGLRTAEDKEVLRYYDFIFKTNEYLEDHSWSRHKTLESEGHDIEIKETLDF